MFRIRQVDGSHPGDQRDLVRVQEILRDQLPGLPPGEVETLPERLHDPLKYQMRAILLVADDMRGHLKSFALLSFAPDIKFCLLDYIASGKRSGGGGIGGALYERARSTARDLGAVGIFLECLPDDPAACSDPKYVKQNAARLRFYERYGARPIVGTGYETPISPTDSDLPHLVFDDLDSDVPLPAATARAVVRAILMRKYQHICPPGYIEKVVASIVDDPVRLRPPKYVKSEPTAPRRRTPVIALVVNEAHDIHHVRERGYVEAPVRIRSILAGLEASGLFARSEPKDYPENHVLAVHDTELVRFVENVCARVPAGKSVYPYVFPVRNRARPPNDLTYSAGYYCIDTFTPLNRNAYLAAKRAVDCALTTADVLLAGQHKLAYALVRPPGHHAERSVFGGFCYFNNNAVAAHYLTQRGKVAILDVDYHHGNGQQDIFYARGDVLTVSIHGDPSFAYPFFTGFAEEVGEGAGQGFNLNLPLPEEIDGAAYRETLRVALDRIASFGPQFLVVALGLDTAKRDPTGTWSLIAKDFEQNGRMIGDLGLPTLVVQEGGYRNVSLGANARGFFHGLASSHPGGRS